MSQLPTEIGEAGESRLGLWLGVCMPLPQGVVDPSLAAS